MSLAIRERERNLMSIALAGEADASARIVMDLDEEDLYEPQARWLLAELAKRVWRGHQYHDLIPYANEDQSLYLDDLHGRYVTSATAPDLLAAIKGATRRRKAGLVLGRAAERVKAGDDSAIPEALGELAAIMSPTTANRVHGAGDILRAAKARIEAMRGGKVKRYLSLGMKKTEKALAIQPGQLCVIGARTGVGKTALALSWTWAMAFASNTPLLYLNSEMDTAEIGIRLASIGGNLHHSSLRVDPTDDQWAKVCALIEDYETAPAFTSEAIGTLTSAEVVALTRHHHALHGVEVLIVDYIQRLGDWQGRRDVSEWQILMEITRTLKNLATGLGIVVICLAQLNSTGELAASKGMANECDLVLALERCRDDDDKEGRQPPKTEGGQTHLLWVQKGRHISSDLQMPLRMDPFTLRFSEVY